MNLLRRLGLALWLAFALLAGQQAVVLHDLGHALERKQGGTPAEKTCGTHALCAQLGSAVGAPAPVLARPPAVLVSAPTHAAEGFAQRTFVAYRSQGPPPAIALPA